MIGVIAIMNILLRTSWALVSGWYPTIVASRTPYSTSTTDLVTCYVIRPGTFAVVQINPRPAEITCLSELIEIHKVSFNSKNEAQQYINSQSQCARYVILSADEIAPKVAPGVVSLDLDVSK